jgi:chaperonin GroEL
MQHRKVQSTGKVVRLGQVMDATIASTLATISRAVGCTLGPGGKTVIIERQEENMPPLVTKDGVTVFRSLGFEDPAAQAVMEASRDAAVRTANEAGDGTTTATVLAEAIYRHSRTYAKEHAADHVSPQKIVRRLATAFADVAEPAIKSATISVPKDSAEAEQMLRAIARTSANGDDSLATAVMECFKMVGDEGNVTITEMSGPAKYEVERIEGYNVPHGWDDCCGKYSPKFINDPARQRLLYEKPTFIVYHGQLTEILSAVKILDAIVARWQENNGRHNVVVVATGFSESVVAQFALNNGEKTSINVFPLRAPLSPVPGGQLSFLEDICAYTGAKMFDPINKSLDDFAPDLSDLGENAYVFEAQRHRSLVAVDFGTDEEPSDAAILISERVEMIKAQMAQAPSDLDQRLMTERIGKLTGGIARLKVVGSSHGDIRERRDRAEDAVCAVRGAIQHGCLPGGGWGLLKVAFELGKLNDPIVDEILCAALEEPVRLLFSNVGFSVPEVEDHLARVGLSATDGTHEVYDALAHEWVDAVEAGLLDSAPAVCEAIRNSLSIAAQLATTGAIVVFPRDQELERGEARAARAAFGSEPAIPENPADERG